MATNIGKTGESKVRRDDVAKYGLGTAVANAGATGTVGGGPTSVTRSNLARGPQVAPTGTLLSPAAGHGGGTSALVPGSAAAQPQGITGTITPTPTSSIARAYKQGFDAGTSRGGGVGHGSGTSKAAAPKPAAKPKAKAAPTGNAPKTSERPKPRPKAEAQPKGLLGKVGKALAANKANIQSKALERMKKSGRKG